MNRSGIHIKKSHEGLFTAKADKAGESVQGYAKEILANPNASPVIKKQANFARNAAKWHKKKLRPEGGKGLRLEARAAGGPVEKDKKYLVGEEGPEVMMTSDNPKVLIDSTKDIQESRLEPMQPMMTKEYKTITKLDPGVEVIHGMKKAREYPRRNKGGPVKKGKAYMVGEKGPEIFTPKQNGKIIPNKKLRHEGAGKDLRKEGMGCG